MNWTDETCGFSFLMIEIRPSAADCVGTAFYVGVHSFAAQKLSGNLSGPIRMKLAGFLLLLSGWGIVVSTLPLLPSLPIRAAFALAGMAVELIGLTLVVRSHRVQEG
jgi:hypothetical protein